MEDGITIDLGKFNDAVTRTAALTHRSFADELRVQAKGVISELVKVTPPRGGKWNLKGPAAEKGAKQKIARDIGGGSGTGRRGTRRVGVFTVLSDSLIDSALETGIYETVTVRLWTRKDGTVYGTQAHFFRPDASMTEMREHHKRYFKNGRMSQAGAYTRDIGRWKWIDQMVVRASTFNRYLDQMEYRVGWYAGGTAPIAKLLGVPMPNYMRRHASSSPGWAREQIGESRMTISFENRVNFRSVDRDMERRLQWAYDIQAKKMERRLPYLARHAAKTAGLSTT